MSDAQRNRYLDAKKVDRRVARGDHRGIIGGLWDQIGQLQSDFLIQRGLRPEHFLLDVGCGALRTGVKIVPYLEPKHYFGIDINQSLIDAGYTKEVVPAGLSDRLPRENLAASASFDASSFGRRFDYAIAMSVFTHVPLDDIRLCLNNLAGVMADGGRFFATFFELFDGDRSSAVGGTTYVDRDPYHYKASEMERACEGLPWKMQWHGAWGHPRGQHIAEYVIT